MENETSEKKAFTLNTQTPSFLIQENGHVIGTIKFAIKFDICVNQTDKSESTKSDFQKEKIVSPFPQLSPKMPYEHKNCRSDDANNLKAYYTNIYVI